MNPGNPETVEAMQKVTLTLTPIAIANQNNAPVTVELIVGLGVSGPTPFEQQLIGRGVGESFTVDLTSGCWEATMAPIPWMPTTVWTDKPPKRVTVTIQTTQLADPREIVKQMAYSSGGCGGGCDCGCDGH